MKIYVVASSTLKSGGSENLHQLVWSLDNQGLVWGGVKYFGYKKGIRP